MVPDVPGPSARAVVHRRRRVQYRMSDENSSESPDHAEPTASEGRVDRPFPGGQYVVPAPAVVEPSEPSTEVVELTEEELDADPDEMSDEDAAAVLSHAVTV